MSNPQGTTGLPAYGDLYPKSKWHLSQKVSWSLIIGLLALSITFGSYTIHDTIKRAHEEPIEKLIEKKVEKKLEKLMVQEKAEFLDEIIHVFPSMRKKLIDFAVMKNENQWVKTLLWSEAQHFRQDSYRIKFEKKSPPLHVATENDNPEIVQTLLDFGWGYKINQIDTESGSDFGKSDNWTAIFEAAYIPDSKVLKVLIQYGANVNQTDADSYAPLHYAALQNSTKNVEILLQNDADPNAKTRHWHQTPLLFAVWNKNVEMIKLLLENGADPTIHQKNFNGKRGQSPLDYVRNDKLKDLIVLLDKYV